MFKLLEITSGGVTVGCSEFDTFSDAFAAYQRGCKYLEGDAALFGSTVEFAIYNDDESEMLASSLDPDVEKLNREYGYIKGGK